MAASARTPKPGALNLTPSGPRLSATEPGPSDAPADADYTSPPTRATYTPAQPTSGRCVHGQRDCPIPTARGLRAGLHGAAGPIGSRTGSPAGGDRRPCARPRRRYPCAVHRGRERAQERPAGTGEGARPRPTHRRHAGDRQARPAEPQRRLPAHPAGQRRPLPRLRHARGQRPHRRHHGPRRPAGARGDLPPHEGGAGGGQGARRDARQPQRRRGAQTGREGRRGAARGRPRPRRRPRRSTRPCRPRPAGTRPHDPPGPRRRTRRRRNADPPRREVACVDGEESARSNEGVKLGSGSTFFDGLSVDNATGIVDQPRLPRFKEYTNYDNNVGIGTWTKIGLNNTDYNDQGAFDSANNRFVAPADGTYLFGATLLYKVNASTTARMSGRLVLNGSTEIRGSLGEISATHVSLATAIWLQTMVPLTAGDTVELQGYFRVADGYFAAEHTSFWGAKIG